MQRFPSPTKRSGGGFQAANGIVASSLDCDSSFRYILTRQNLELGFCHLPLHPNDSVGVQRAQSIEEAQPLLLHWLEEWGMQDVKCRQLVVRGGAAERILDCVEDLDIDLLVIGVQHKFFADETVIGTTTERLLRFAICPVFTVLRPALGNLCTSPARGVACAAVPYATARRRPHPEGLTAHRTCAEVP